MDVVRYYSIALPIGLAFTIGVTTLAWYFSDGETPRPETYRHIHHFYHSTGGSYTDGQSAFIVTPEKTYIHNRDGEITQINHFDGERRVAAKSRPEPVSACTNTHKVAPQSPSRVHHPESQTRRSDNQSRQSQPAHTPASCSCQDGAACPRD